MPEATLEASTEDYFLGDRIKIRQPVRGYRAGVDAVLLAASVKSPVRDHLNILDIGAGVGVVGICAATRISNSQVTLLERETELVSLAQSNVASNALGGRIRVIQADIAAPLSAAAVEALPPDTFNVVLANPPFHDEHRGTAAASALKAAAHAMPEGALEDWARFMARMTSPGGTATMIHKAEALPSILQSFEGRFGALQVKPIYARAGEPAIRVLVSGTKGSRAPLVLRDGFVLHAECNAFTPEAEGILRRGAAMRL